MPLFSAGYSSKKAKPVTELCEVPFVKRQVVAPVPNNLIPTARKQRPAVEYLMCLRECAQNTLDSTAEVSKERTIRGWVKKRWPRKINDLHPNHLDTQLSKIYISTSTVLNVLKIETELL